MKIPSSDIPQADILDDVVNVVKAVGKGRQTFQDIAQYIGKVDRQGRYYRRAAEILGFIQTVNNTSILTDSGEKFLKSSEQERDVLLFNMVFNTRLFQRMIPFLESEPDGLTKQEIQRFMTEVTEPVGESMMPRRVSTVISWLERLSVLNKIGDNRYKLSGNITQHAVLLEFDNGEPLLPKSKSLKAYETVEERTGNAILQTPIMRDQVASERAVNAHIRLVNLIAERLRDTGTLPRCNQLIDLAASVDGQPYIFEMKSMTRENARSQIRSGVSQLYEYRYLQNIPDARLVLVAEIPLPNDIRWMSDYLEKDRGIWLLWDGGNKLFASPETQREMQFLWDNPPTAASDPTKLAV